MIAPARVRFGELWPVHPKPKGDELLSSWLSRLAMGHGQKLHTFCSMMWPGMAIWNRDVDKSATAEMVLTLAKRTATSFEAARACTLAAYEGSLYERHNRFGPNPWIMPVGVYHRTRRRFGLMYCRRCLSEDAEPYYRRRWRLAFMAVCDKDGTPLRDRCPRCRAPVCFHRNELGDHKKFAAESLTLCHACGLDLRESDGITLNAPGTLPPPAALAEIEFTRELLRAVHSGYAKVGLDTATYSVLYFAGLRHLLKILAMSNARVERLRQAISLAYGVESYAPSPSRPRPDVQELDVEARRRLLGLARCLLQDWPHRFVELSRESGVWSSLWLRHLGASRRGRENAAPFWFWNIVDTHLNRARYCPSEEEIRSALAHLKREGRKPNNSKLARLLGVAAVRRKGIL